MIRLRFDYTATVTEDKNEYIMWAVLNVPMLEWNKVYDLANDVTRYGFKKSEDCVAFKIRFSI